jgi:hypothetical protein
MMTRVQEMCMHEKRKMHVGDQRLSTKDVDLDISQHRITLNLRNDEWNMKREHDDELCTYGIGIEMVRVTRADRWVTMEMTQGGAGTMNANE